MNQVQLIDIANAKTHIETALELEKRFVAHISNHAVPDNVPTRLNVTGREISVPWFALTATAVGRMVRDGDGDFITEYVFYVPHGDDCVEVWRCYLRPNGRLSEQVSGDVGVCDHDNKYIAMQICGRVVLGILNSAVYRPD
ncbi:hypothetical protein JJ685_14765 [Ramlibacter monticola]|uniref:Uncharacterized protein n=1 Tax=Ramlibacter monticola TaxID=1926872 RepID=A0A936Z1X8_9BURK|nr:hypothetical protein [Ramlibacter monticola]MBL0392399.1 hypothetical protein [Ramlibacter monticola]